MKKKIQEALNRLSNFIGQHQMVVVKQILREEEKEWMEDKILELDNLTSNMPKVYEQEGKGDNAIVFLHYFRGSYDWFITEKDTGEEQIQAFGLAKSPDREYGYISIKRLIQANVELDFHWEPKPVNKC